MKTTNAADASTYLGIHEQKVSALEHGASEEPIQFPITASDLVRVDRCPVCFGSKSLIISEVYLQEELNFFQTSTCKNCLFTYRSVHPSLAWFERCWAMIDQRVFQGSGTVFNPEGEVLRRKRYEEYLGILGNFGTGSLLDIGAAWGTGTNVFKKSGYDVSAIEPEVGKRNYIQRQLGIPIIGASIHEILADDAPPRYQFIIFAHCLEHIEDPASVMRSLGRMMQPRGIVYLEVPLLWNYVNWSDALFLPHKSNFTIENLMDLAHEGGFTVVEQHWLRHHSVAMPDIGLVLRYTRTQVIDVTPPTHTIDEVKNLYRKDLPLQGIKPNQVLPYSVAAIEHAAQIVNTRGKKMALRNGFIVFE